MHCSAGRKRRWASMGVGVGGKEGLIKGIPLPRPWFGE